MKTHLYIIGVMVSLMSFSTLKAQVEQSIVVTEYNGKSEKTPLSGVNVTVLNAASTMSGEDGKAILRFRTLHAGDKVSIRRIEKSGYELFNSMATDQWTVSTNRPFQLVLCRSDKFKALRDQYSRVASDSYAKQYKAEMARLASERKKTKMLEETYQQKLLDLENQYQQQLEDLENYVDQFARIDLSELNSQQQELIDLVQQGKIDEAIQKYESADYQAQYQKQSEEIAKIDRAQAQLAVIEAQKRSEREKVFQTISRQIATYRLAGGRENFNKVNTLMKAVADADTTNLEAVFAYAEHAMHQNMIEDCEKYFHIYIRGCEDNPYLQASAWYMLGQGYFAQTNYDKAENAFLKAYAILQILSTQEPERFANFSIVISHRLSKLFLWLGKNKEAIELLEKALPLCEKLHQEDPEAYQHKLADLYGAYSLGLFYEGNAEQAMLTAKNACELARKYYKETAETANILIASLNQLAQVLYFTQQWNEFITTCKEMVEIDATFYKQNPQEHTPNMQSHFNNLAEGYLHLNDFENCESYLIKSEQMLKNMIAEDHQTHAYDKINLYDIAVRLYHALGNAEKKESYLQMAREAFEQMVPEEKEMSKEMMDQLNAL